MHVNNRSIGKRHVNTRDTDISKAQKSLEIHQTQQHLKKRVQEVYFPFAHRVRVSSTKGVRRNKIESTRYTHDKHPLLRKILQFAFILHIVLRIHCNNCMKFVETI